MRHPSAGFNRLVAAVRLGGVVATFASAEGRSRHRWVELRHPGDAASSAGHVVLGPSPRNEAGPRFRL